MILSTLILVAFLLIFIISLRLKSKEANSIADEKTKSELFKLSEVHKNDWFRAFFLCCIVAWIMVILYNMKYLGYEEPKSFPASKIDGLIALGIILGLIGAIWAVLARIDAEKAFNGTRDILNSLGTSFEFAEILNSDKFGHLLKKIPAENTTICIYVGFPCIGLLYDNPRYEFKNLSPQDSLIMLTNKIKAIPSNIEKIDNFKLYISVINQVDANKIMEKVPIDKQCKKEIDAFYKTLKEAQDLRIRSNKITFREDFNLAEKLRFISIKTEGKQNENKAMVWIADIQTKESETKDVTNSQSDNKYFDSKGFQTNDSKFIEVLENIFQIDNT